MTFFIREVFNCRTVLSYTINLTSVSSINSGNIYIYLCFDLSDLRNFLIGVIKIFRL